MRWIIQVLVVLLLSAAAGHAGEALVTRVRGGSLAIDMGAEAGLMVGMEVTVVRPPGEAVFHPITGENLGAHEIEIGRGEITKTSTRAASVRIQGSMLLQVRPGDVVRFLTPEEEMILDQERQVERQEKNEQEHEEFRGEVSRLARSIKDVQGRIGGLEQMMKRVERVEEGFRVQLRGINNDINTMKQDIKDLKESVALMGAVPVKGLEEAADSGRGIDLSREEDVAQLKEIVRGVIQDEVKPVVAPQAQAPAPLEEEDLALPPMEEDLALEAEAEAEEPFYKKSWFYGILGAIGILSVVAFLYMRMTAASEEDEEEEVDEEIEEVEEEEDLDMEVEEEDDIVVEETS